MNIEHLKLFIRIATTKNISKAGKELGLSPAVSSSHINKLEEGLGVKLIHRTTRKVSLTEEGQVFLPHAEEALASIAAAQASIGVGSIIPQGTLRVTAPASFGRMHIIPALGEFQKHNPELKIDLRLSDGIIDMVEGGFDIAVRNASLNDSNLIARKLSADKRIICASPEYIQKHGEPQNPSELLNHQCINLIGIDSWGFKTPEGHLNIKAPGTIRVDNGEAIRDLCVDGVGITISSLWCAYKKLESGELIHILKDFPLTSDTAIWAVYPSSRLLAPKVRAFIDFFVLHFGHTPYWEPSSLN
ncbi:LysR family transcriptional regulator [Marinicella sp. W31]|uniref:LysR family transcriptional regulator n=1 Tax=Marinicella sp. W31 TaxID=3023713 RepID=UPI003757F65D